MSDTEIQKNYAAFLELVNQKLKSNDDAHEKVIQGYIRQNVALVNDVLSLSVNKLKKLQNIKSKNDIICMHARLINQIKTKINHAEQQFLNASLGDITTNYDEWLQLHCDLATD